MNRNREPYPFHAARAKYGAEHAQRMAAAVAAHDARKARAAMVNRLARLAVFACVLFAMIAVFYGVTR